MFAVEAAEDEVLPLLDGRSDAGIAAVNGPRSVVVSGAEDTVAEVAAELAAAGRRTTRLRVSHAFHSPLMDPMLDAFREVAASLTYNEPTMAVVSTVTGQPAEPGLLTDPEYWVRHVRQPVRFHDALLRLRALGARRFLEVGPDSRLTALAETALTGTAPTGTESETTAAAAPSSAQEPVFTAAVLRDRPERHRLLTAVATLFAHGVDPDWTALLPGARPPCRCRPTPSSGSATGSPPCRSPRPPGPTRPATRSSTRRSPGRARRNCCSPGGCRRARTPGSPTTPSSARSSCPPPATSTSPCTQATGLTAVT